MIGCRKNSQVAPAPRGAGRPAALQLHFLLVLRTIWLPGNEGSRKNWIKVEAAVERVAGRCGLDKKVEELTFWSYINSKLPVYVACTHLTKALVAGSFSRMSAAVSRF